MLKQLYSVPAVDAEIILIKNNLHTWLQAGDAGLKRKSLCCRNSEYKVKDYFV